MSDSNAHNLVLGVDAGGTKTVAWLAGVQNGEVVGRGSAGPGNPRAVGFDKAFENLQSAIEMAFADAGTSCGTVASACLALAGADRESERRELDRWANERQLAKRLQIVNDALPV